MEKKFQKSLFLFRRDLRLEDNTGLIFALKSSEVVIPAFIFTPEQIDKNPFKKPQKYERKIWARHPPSHPAIKFRLWHI